LLLLFVLLLLLLMLLLTPLLWRLHCLTPRIRVLHASLVGVSFCLIFLLLSVAAVFGDLLLTTRFTYATGS